MSTTYVIGHRNPDTDSICAAICLSYLRNKLGDKTEPRALGHLSRESKFVLDYFNVREPAYLNDVRIQIKDITYHKKAMVNENVSILEAFEFMQKKVISGVPIVDEKKKLKGLITLKEISRELICGDIGALQTSYTNLLKVLKAEEILKFEEEIVGNVLSATYYSATFADKVILKNSDILIVADRYKILEYALNASVKMIVLVGGAKLPKELLKIAKKNRVNVISTVQYSYEIANKIKLCNYVKNLCVNSNPVTFDQYDYRDEFKEKTQKYGHTNYPVINKKGDCLGVIKATMANSYEKKRVMLVDHNQAEQSVPGIEEAIIDGIVDHHNLGTIGTALPINFRVMPVGCTCSILYQLYTEANVTIPRDMAGLMLAAILSDTLMFQSPTTTQIDIDAAKKLAKIAKVKELEFGNKMFKAGSSIENMSAEEVFYQDFKSYKVFDKDLGISQVITMDIEEVKSNVGDYINLLDRIANDKYEVVVLFITDILKNGSYVLFNTNAKELVGDAFAINNIEECSFISGLVSRKKQMLPDLMEAIEKSGS